ncbi:hypothetical protein ACLOJK_018023 [Asimina triloba]
MDSNISGLNRNLEPIQAQGGLCNESSLPISFLRRRRQVISKVLNRLLLFLKPPSDPNMPATAGRVRMPANNRVHSSAALQTHGIWQSAIGYDPYAPDKNDSKQGSKNSNAVEPEAENAYASFQGLLALARITGSNADEARGACKKCGRVGHLTFQCRNFLSIKCDDKDKDGDALQAVASVLDKSRGNGKGVEDSTYESSEESESSDSSVDSAIERIIATRSGKKSGKTMKTSASKKRAEEDGFDSGGERKRGRSRSKRSDKRASEDSEDEREKDRKRRKEKRRRINYSDDEDDENHRSGKSRKEKKRSHDYSDDEDDGHRHRRKSRKEKKRRRSHRYSDDSDESEESDKHHKQRKNRRASTSEDSGSSSSDDSQGGRGRKRSGKKSRKHRQRGEK